MWRHQYHRIPLQKQSQILRILEEETSHQPQKNFHPLQSTFQNSLEIRKRHGSPQNPQRCHRYGKIKAFRRLPRSLWHQEEIGYSRCLESRQVVKLQKILQIGRPFFPSRMGQRRAHRKSWKQEKRQSLSMAQEENRRGKQGQKIPQPQGNQQSQGRIGHLRLLIAI